MEEEEGEEEEEEVDFLLPLLSMALLKEELMLVVNISNQHFTDAGDITCPCILS